MAKLEQTDAVKPVSGNDAGEHTARMQAEVQQQMGNSNSGRATDAPPSGGSAGGLLPKLDIGNDSFGTPGGGGGTSRCFEGDAAGSNMSSSSKGQAGDSAAAGGHGTGAYKAGHTDMVTTRHR